MIIPKPLSAAWSTSSPMWTGRAPASSSSDSSMEERGTAVRLRSAARSFTRLHQGAASSSSGSA